MSKASPVQLAVLSFYLYLPTPNYAVVYFSNFFVRGGGNSTVCSTITLGFIKLVTFCPNIGVGIVSRYKNHDTKVPVYIRSGEKYFTQTDMTMRQTDRMPQSD